MKLFYKWTLNLSIFFLSAFFNTAISKDSNATILVENELLTCKNRLELMQTSNLSVERTVDKPVFRELGEVLTFTLKIRNLCMKPIEKLIVHDMMAEGSGWNEGVYIIPSLAGGETKTLIYTISTTEAHLQSMEINNLVTVSNPLVETDKVEDAINIPYYRINIEIFTDKDYYLKTDTITAWTLRVHNKGKAVLKDLIVKSDIAKGSDWNDDFAKIPLIYPGKFYEFTYKYPIRAFDRLFCHVTNYVSVIDPLFPQIEHQHDVRIPVEHLKVFIYAADQKFLEVGRVIVFKITVNNRHQQGLKNLTIENPHGNGPGWVDGKYFLPKIEGFSSEEIEYTYIVTEEDVLAKQIVHHVQVTDPLRPNPDIKAVATVPFGPVSMKFNSDWIDYYEVGDEINSALVVRNHSSEMVLNLVVEDEMGVDFGWGGTKYIIDYIAPHSFYVVDCKIKITQKHIDDKMFYHKATLTAPLDPSLLLESTDTLYYFNWEVENKNNTPIFYEVDEEIDYTLSIHNKGGEDLLHVGVLDWKADGEDWYGHYNILDDVKSGESFIYNYKFKTDSADIKRKFSRGETEASTLKNFSYYKRAYSSSLYSGYTVHQSADKKYFTAVGEIINYTLTLKNEGSVDLLGLRVKDPMATGVGWVDGEFTIPLLAKEDSIEFKYSYEVTAADLNNGEVINAARVSDPSSPIPYREAKLQIPLYAYEIVKTASKTVFKEVDEEILYTLTLTNKGTMDLENLVVTDPLAKGDCWLDGKYLIPALAAGNAIDLVYSYTVSEVDLINKAIKNTVTISDLLNPTVVRKDSLTLLFTDFSMSKEADLSQVSKVGEVINYRVSLINTGAVDVIDLVVEDQLANGTGWVAGKYTIPLLAVGDSIDLVYSYTVTAVDISNKKVVNTAKVIDPLYPADVKEVMVLIPVAGFEVTKIADLAQVSKVGDVINYTLRLVNTGAVGLVDLVVEDQLANGIGWVAGKYTIPLLAVGDSIDLVYSYTVTAADISNKVVVNTAKVIDPLYPVDSKEVSVVVQVLKRMIVAINDGPIQVSGAVGGTTLSVLDNDSIDGKPVNLNLVKLSWDANNPLVTGIVLQNDGTLSVSPGIKKGTYIYRYTICELLNTQNCATARLTLTITSAIIQAADDSFRLTESRQDQYTLSVFANDHYAEQGLDLEKVIFIPGTASDLMLSMQDDGTIKVRAGIKPGTYTYSYTLCEKLNPDNCSDAVANIHVEAAQLFIPNTFTPNGDGVNDLFEIVGLANYDAAKLRIINHWGSEVYVSSNYQNTWTGKGLNNGTYYYSLILTKGTQEEEYKGWVLLKR